MAEMNERELLSAILTEVRTIHAKVDAVKDELLTFRRETSERFNRIEGRLEGIEDGQQRHERLLEKLALGYVELKTR